MNDPKLVLAMATHRAGQALGFTTLQTAKMLGLNQACFNQGIDPQSSAGQRALMLIRIYQHLDVLLGADSTLIKHWMSGQNQGTQGIPSQQVQTTEGMEQVLGYLDAIRKH